MPPPSIIPSSSGGSGARKRKGGPQAIAPAPPRHLPGHLQRQVVKEVRSSPSTSVSSLDHDHDQDDDNDNEYLPRPPSKSIKQSVGTKKRNAGACSSATTPSQGQGGSGGKMSKTSREALRKANHSLIERRRREKINAALGELREMVPGLGEGGSKGGEFKLEVLERTVSHMKDLKRHIKNLEAALQAHGIHFEPQEGDRGSPDEDEDEDVEQDDHDDEDDEGDSGMNVDGSHHASIGTAFGGGLPAGSARDYEQGVSDTNRSSHAAGFSGSSTSSSSYQREHPQQYHSHPATAYKHQLARVHSESHSYNRQHAHSPYPSPSPDAKYDPLSPDPNETEPEPNLPPPLTKAQPRPKHQLPRSFKGEMSPSNGLRSHSGSPNPMTAPSVASLLASAQDRAHSPYSGQSSPSQNQTLSRPSPPPQANNPIFLPFPAPSPTSPFLTSNGGLVSSIGSSSGPGSSSGSTGLSGPPDPSPFLAPLSGMSLFGGVIPLENGLTSPIDMMSSSGRYSHNTNGNGPSSIYNRQQHSPPDLTLPPSKSYGDDTRTHGHSREVSGSLSRSNGHIRNKNSIGGTSMNGEQESKDMPAEEAANLLLAFSSPDTLRPQIVSSASTSSVTSISGGLTITRGRRSTMDSDEFEFSLDSGGQGFRTEDMVGKSARDILRMTEFQR
ncbi:hypothetical protein IAU59_002860 [Kwoniella sp. CBS 9459]